MNNIVVENNIVETVRSIKIFDVTLQDFSSQSVQTAKTSERLFKLKTGPERDCIFLSQLKRAKVTVKNFTASCCMLA